MTACVDCLTEGVTTKRPIVSGIRKQRCASHDRAHKKKAKARNHGRMVERVYSLTAEQYDLLYQAQGGRCAICQVATGQVRRLAVDHDHSCTEGHPPQMGCLRCIRGCLCGPCNVLIGRYKTEALLRALDYLLNPPARKVFNEEVGCPVVPWGVDR